MDKMYKYENREKDSQEKPNMVPVYRGCSNNECFCTGKCREIIGYEEVIEKRFYPKKDSKY
jgi:hypothetical protein